VVEQREDRNQDGEPDFTAFFEDGRAVRIEADTAGRGCTDLRQWLDAEGAVIAEERAAEGGCRTATWSYFRAGVLVRQAQDTSGDGRADVLSHLDANGRVAVQELATGAPGEPTERIEFSADGSVRLHCIDGDGDGRLEMAVVFDGDELRLARVDSDLDGRVDTREHYTGGVRDRIEADTNGDGLPDVVQHLDGEDVVRQDEDSDFDGSLDRSFEGPAAVELQGEMRVEPFGRLDCGRFDRFWRR
jgi:hypothetical protein